MSRFRSRWVKYSRAAFLKIYLSELKSRYRNSSYTIYYYYCRSILTNKRESFIREVSANLNLKTEKRNESWSQHLFAIYCKINHFQKAYLNFHWKCFSRNSLVNSIQIFKSNSNVKEKLLSRYVWFFLGSKAVNLLFIFIRQITFRHANYTIARQQFWEVWVI